MRYPKGAATLLSTVFSFGVNSGVVADIFDSSNELLSGTDTAGNGLTATPPNSPTSAVTQQNSATADPGILENPAATSAGGTDVIASSSEITIAATCDEYVICKDGYDISDVTGNTKCFDTCDEDCCTYDNAGTLEDACSLFTGKVCKDGYSCNGDNACALAIIPSVVNSCSGDFACFLAGADGGSIGNVNDSCNGKSACYNLAYHNGKVGNVLNSCIGYRACRKAARTGGLIGSITDSCKEGSQACNELGFGYGNVGNILNACKGDYACEHGAYHGGSIGSITRSCFGERACDSLGESGDIGNINLSCTSTYSCYYGGAYGGIVGNIVSSCTADDACRDLGRGKGKVGHVTNSCTGTESCEDAGSNRGAIGSITQSCGADNACDGAGSGSSGGITSNLKACCNTVDECKDATQATLPATCKASKVRESVIYDVCSSVIGSAQCINRFDEYSYRIFQSAKKRARQMI
jgi:hypothetical protein